MKYKTYRGFKINVEKGKTASFATFTRGGKKCSNAIIDGTTEEDARIKAKLYLDKCFHYNKTI